MYRFFCEPDAFLNRDWPAGPNHNYFPDIADGCHGNVQRWFHAELNWKGELEFEHNSLRYDQFDRSSDPGEDHHRHLHHDDQRCFRDGKHSDYYSYSERRHTYFDYTDRFDHHSSAQQHGYFHRNGNVQWHATGHHQFGDLGRV